MILRLVIFCAFATLTTFFSSCVLIRNSSKYGFNDGVYQTRQLPPSKKVYVLRIDDDTIAVFPVKEYKDSTAIITSQRINYATTQRKLKDNKTTRMFYHPSFDLDLMTIPMKYRPRIDGLPNQLTTNFSGAIYSGYRIDAYRLNYRRTPLNTFKQKIHHFGYSGGVFLGIGNTLVDAFSLRDPNVPTQYEGVLLISGVAVTMAAENLTFGISIGSDHLLDENKHRWVYEGKPYLGFTLGLNLN